MRAAELDLVLVDRADLEVISVLARTGKVKGALAHIGQTVYEDELPASTAIRVNAPQRLLEYPAVLVFSVNDSALP